MKQALKVLTFFLASVLDGPTAETTRTSSSAPASTPPPAAASSDSTSAASAPVQLQKVEVTARQESSYNSIDRKVYNVGKDVISTTGTASDLLQNVPSVQVDINGIVSLRGDPGVEILINGKPSALMGRNRAAALEQLSAGEIERIEVITNPSAKFRPDGTGGIINLIMKREHASGYSGSVRASIGNEERYHTAVSVSFNPGRYTVYGNASLRQDHRTYVQAQDRARFDPAGNPLGTTKQDSTTQQDPFSRFVRVGVDFRSDDATKVGASLVYDDRESKRHAIQRSISRDPAGTLVQDYDRLRGGNEIEDEIELALTFERTFAAPDHALSAELRLGQGRDHEDNQFTNHYRTPATASSVETTRVRDSEQDTDLSIDYVRPFAAEAKLEVGYEGEREYTELDFHAANVDLLTGVSVPDLRRTNRFIYDGTIHAIYATYERPLGKFGVLGGLRLEHASIDTNQATTGVASTNRYARLYPSLHMSYRFNDAHEAKLSYSHRVNRPDGDELNPFIEYDDPLNLRAGNPALVPEDVHSIEAGYQFEHDETTYLASLYLRHRRNGFTEVTRTIAENTLLTTDENLATSDALGLEIGATTRFEKRLALNFSANAYHQEIDAANLGFTNRRSAFAFNAKLNANWDVTDRLLLQFTTSYTARRLTPQGERHPYHLTNLGLRYDFKDRRTSLVLTVSDLFKTLQDRTTLDTPTLKGDVTRSRNSRVFYIGIIYNFGRAAKNDRKLEFEESL